MTMETKITLLGGALLVALFYGLRVLVAHRERKLRQRSQASAGVAASAWVACHRHACRYRATETVWHKELMQPVTYCHADAVEAIVRGQARILGSHQPT